MAPLTTKRRKLEHTSEDEETVSVRSDNQESEIESGSEDEEGSAQEENAARSKPANVPAKRRHDDQDAALYAGGMYKSSMFKLQVDEMLTEIRPNYEKRARAIKDALHQLKNSIEGIEDRGPLSVYTFLHRRFTNH
jgi:U3 small nucleolar RNA-associated protein 22